MSGKGIINDPLLYTHLAGLPALRVDVIAAKVAFNAAIIATITDGDISGGTYLDTYSYSQDFILDNILLYLDMPASSPYIELNFGTNRWIVVQNWPSGYTFQNVALVDINLAIEADKSFGLKIAATGASLVNGYITAKV